MTGTIGPLDGGQDAVDGMRATLELWVPSVTAAYNAAKNVTLRPPALVDMALTVEALSAAQTPGLAVATTGLLSEPERDSRGIYRAEWGLTVRILARNVDIDGAPAVLGTEDATSRAVHGYAVIVRTAVMQHRSLGIHAKTRWIGEQYIVVDPNSAATLGGADIAFGVELRDVLDAAAGPDTPPDLGSPFISYPPTAATEAIVTPMEE